MSEGNTEDRTRVDLNVPVWDRSIPPPTDEIPYHEANAVTIGRDFYTLSSHLPAGTKLTWGLNLRSMNITETFIQAKHLASSFAREELGHVEMAGVEIGNEVDGFQVTPYTNLSFTGWTPYNYTNTWMTFASNVSGVLGLDQAGEQGRGLQVGSFMASGNSQPWNPLTVLGTGVLDQAVKKGVKWWSDHFYTGVWGMGSPPSAGTLMAKGTVRGVLSQRMVDIGIAKRSGLKFIVVSLIAPFGDRYGSRAELSGRDQLLRQVSCKSDCNRNLLINDSHGAPGLSNTAEAAIWAVDYMLQAASLGVSRVHFHNGLGYRYNAFQPVAGLQDDTNMTSRAHILPLYHAFLIVNEAIGADTGAGPYVAELGTLDRTLAVYGIWKRGDLKRMVMIHSGLYQDGQRGRLDVELQGAGLDEKEVRVKRLRTPKTESVNGL